MARAAVDAARTGDGIRHEVCWWLYDDEGRRALLEKIPQCRTLVVTGEKAAETLSGQLQCEIPAVGHCAVTPDGLTVWRMPSTSRAYPLALEKKAQQYRKVFDL